MNELLLAQLIMGVSALLPAGLMKLLNPDGTKSIGYNTPTAHKSAETRTFANRYATRGMFWAGLGIVTVQVTLYFLLPGSTGILITAGVMTFGFLAVVGLTERELNQRFDKDGKPKEEYSRF
ncbi:MAG: SdpI family protein [Roseivirga sp.]|nr:SdpI family protein [Roseivirga sp.]